MLAVFFCKIDSKIKRFTFLQTLFVLLIAIFSLLLGTVKAETHSQKVNLVYDVYNKGLHVITIKAQYTLSPDSYKVKTHFYSAGIASLVFHMNIHSSVEGRFKDNSASPGLFSSEGYSRGAERQTIIDFAYGNHVTVKTLSPAREDDRDPLTDTQIQNSLDLLSGMTELIYRVRETGKCEAQFNIFDGLRLLQFHSWTEGKGQIPATWSSPYQGPAIVCHGIAQQTGGLKQSRHRALMAKEQPGTLWFKNIKGAGMLPVRFDFLHPKMGVITAILQPVDTDND